MTLSEAARNMISQLREEYVKAGHPNHNIWMFRPGPEDLAAFNELRSNRIIRQCEIGHNPRWRLTDFGLRKILRPEGSATHQGEVHVGSKFITNITGATIGAIATGDHAVATGHVTIHHGPLTQAQHLENIKAAKKALADDEERLVAADYEALEKFLKQAREVQVESRELGEVQAELEAILDRAWAEYSGKALPQGLKVTQALAQNPAMVGVMKKLLEA